MTKTEALQLLGGTAGAAREIGISVAAISQWPDDLPSRLVDRVQAALWRRAQAATHDTQPGALDELPAARMGG